MLVRREKTVPKQVVGLVDEPKVVELLSKAVSSVGDEKSRTIPMTYDSFLNGICDSAHRLTILVEGYYTHCVDMVEHFRSFRAECRHHNS